MWRGAVAWARAAGVPLGTVAAGPWEGALDAEGCTGRRGSWGYPFCKAALRAFHSSFFEENMKCGGTVGADSAHPSCLKNR